MPSESNGVSHVAVSAITRAVGKTLRLASVRGSRTCWFLFRSGKYRFFGPIFAKEQVITDDVARGFLRLGRLKRDRVLVPACHR